VNRRNVLPITIAFDRDPRGASRYGGSLSTRDETAGGGRRRVLIVEDDGDVADALADILEDAGCAVVVASNGRSALDVVDAFRPDVVLLDLHMPEMDGRQFLAALRRNPPVARTPVIVTSADRGAEVPGADRFIAKPFASQGILDAIDQLLADRA
jgi:CheY-like chemotaxis protein